MTTSIGSKVIPGAKNIIRGAAPYVGAAAAVVGAGIITQSFLKKPEATKNSRYMGDLTFPNDLIDASADRNFYIAIQFMEYQRRSIFNQPFLSAMGGVRLPIPNNLVDTQSVTYVPDQGNEVQGAAIEAGLQGRNGVGSSGGTMGSLVNALAGGLGGATIAGARKSAEAVGINVAQGLQLGGLAQNPFLTVLFQAPTFKKHTFSWKLAPNNIDESNTIREIISTFRSNMLPAMAPNAGGTLLTYPNMAQISLFPEESYMYKFKPCVIESMSVNFTPAGQPSFFKGSNAPTEVQIDLNFLEIEYWLKEDVENNGLRTNGAFTSFNF